MIAYLSGNTQFLEQKRVVERKVAERIVAAGSASMSGAQIHLEKQRVMVCLERTEFGDKFCAFPIRDLAVVERDPHQHGRIILLSDVIIRRISPDVIVR